MPIMPTRVNRVPRLGQPAPVSATGQPAYSTGRGPLLHEQGTPLSNVPIRPSGQPATIDYNGIQLQRGPMAQAAITPPETWSDATHEALSPGYGLRQARNAAADSLSQRNMGIGGYGGMGGMSDGAATRQAELINPMLAANRAQASRRLMTGTQRSQVDNHAQIMANREAAAVPPLAPGLIGADGQRIAPPSMDLYKGKGALLGGGQVNASTIRASQKQAARDLAMKEMLARRSARMTGRPLLPQFRGQQATANQSAMANQPVVVGADGRIIPGQSMAAPLASAGGAVNGSASTGSGVATRMVPNPVFVDARGGIKSPFDMAGMRMGVPINENSMGSHMQDFMQTPFMSGLGNSIGSWWAGIPAGPSKPGQQKPRGGAGAYDPRVTPQNYDIW